MGSSRSATSEEGVSLLWEAQACRGACSIITGHDLIRRGHFTPSVPLRGTCPEWTSTSACLCLPICGGSWRINQADKNAVIIRGTTSPATMPELPRSLSNIVDSSSYKDNRKLSTFKRRKEHKRFKTDARPERKMSPKGKKSEAAASVRSITLTNTDKRILNLVVHLIPKR